MRWHQRKAKPEADSRGRIDLVWVGESVRKLLVPVDVVFLALVGNQWVLWFQPHMARRW